MEKAFTVSEINKIIKGLISREGQLANLEVMGEISNFKKYPSGHCYFNLKDEKSSLKAVMFAGNARYLKALPLNGDKVLAVGRLDVYERDGVYQLYVDMLLPQGTGSLMAAYEKLKAKLLVEGLFDEARKKGLPFQPERIGIVTSSAGAAVRDIIKVSRLRNPAVELVLYPVRVQGVEAPSEIAHAIEFFNENDLADVLIVGRGGGSMEDLWAFNEEIVVRAVAASKLPVISAVGHETDFALSDFAADMRAATPSQAAEIAVRDVAGLKQNLANLERRQLRALLHLWEGRKSALKNLQGSWVFKEPNRLWEYKAQALDKNSEALESRMLELIQNKKHELSLKALKLETLSPLAILARGYSLTETKDGKLVKSVQDVKAGDILKTHVAEGAIFSVVSEGSK